MTKNLLGLLLMGLMALPASGNINARTSDESALAQEETSDQRRPNRPRPPPRRPSRSVYEYWYFLGCARTQFDCQWEATRQGFSRYQSNYNTWTCRNFFYPYTCYARF
jgi:hypothetical protein